MSLLKFIENGSIKMLWISGTKCVLSSSSSRRRSVHISFLDR